MDAARYEQIRDVFHRAAQLPPEDRPEYLDSACENDDALRADVVSLLDEHEHADRPAPGMHAVMESLAELGPRTPQTIGEYQIVRVIGSGGMGVVYEARQTNPKRSVALKAIGAGSKSDGLAARFQNEAAILARLRHPGIAQIYASGTFLDAGAERPYFVMELVEGIEINRWADAQRLDLGARLELLTRVSDAVHHAHQRGVIHRDLKPANILVDSTGQPKILDFGVARLADHEDPHGQTRTLAGELLGTLPYMSPEQLRGDPEDLDTRVDVYALGVLGYQLLAGELPHDLRYASIHESIRALSEDAPRRLAALAPPSRGDPETIIAKAMAKDRTQRYASAADLAADIRRYLTDQPVLARAPSTGYLLRKFARRNRVLVGGITGIIIAVTLGLTGTVIFAVGEASQRARAEKRAGELERVTAFQSSMLRQMDAEAMGLDIVRALNAAPGADASGLNGTTVALELLDHHLLAPTDAAIRDRFSDSVEIASAMHQDLASLSRRLGLLERSLEQQRLALAARRDTFGNDDPRTLESLDGLGLTLQALARYAESEDCYRRALAGRRRVLGGRHPDTLDTENNLGSLMRSVGRYDEAQRHYGVALDGRRSVLGDDHPDSLVTMNNVALLRKARGRFEEALVLYEEAISAARRSLGSEDPLTLSLIANTAACLEAMGDRETALPLYAEALAGRRRGLGDTHPDTLVSINNMGHVLQRLDRHADAMPYCKEAYVTRVATLGPDHPSAITSLNNLAACHRAIGQLDEAIVLQQEAVERAGRVRGENHQATAIFLSNLASMLRESGEPEDALTESTAAAQRADLAFEPAHWRRGSILAEHARCLSACGKRQDAARVLQNAHRILADALGEEDSRTQEVARALISMNATSTEAPASQQP